MTHRKERGHIMLIAQTEAVVGACAIEVQDIPPSEAVASKGISNLGIVRHQLRVAAQQREPMEVLAPLIRPDAPILPPARGHSDVVPASQDALRESSYHSNWSIECIPIPIPYLQACCCIMMYPTLTVDRRAEDHWYLGDF